ncbi:MAG: HTH domain-containing protein [Rhodobacteraceae bacterium]|nr:HTH domain-containing protein [Paracoccaceae bacterium]
MRGARLLHLLMLLQNRGRQSATRLASELEVSVRTIHRDLDALTEAGLPVVVHRGVHGGIELGFDYRSTMTALTGDEAEALALVLSTRHPALDVLGLTQAARRAASKIAESQGAPVRAAMAVAEARFTLTTPPPPAPDDPRPTALAIAVRESRRAVLRARDSPFEVEPIRLRLDGDWVLTCARSGDVPRAEWGDVLISGRRFA